MTRLHKFCLCTFLLSLIPTISSAAEPSVEEWAERRVQTGLIDPLIAKERERSSFSRAALPPKKRRLKILANSLSKDTQGREFARYEVEVLYGKEWQSDIVGCVYQGNGKIYVKRGEQYRPGEFLLGKNVKPVSGVCEAAPPVERS